ncbi:trafficking protein particle complex subunit 8 [Musca domestica]|uniref:ER-Golgi trafficking TRAPP I complex subunit n=1 Tax=Musca domestica TaxID=7370 RepID=T1PJW1_MUSDO|nr:trafficking protein particle complex subunit 8 [Musca domestica]
MIHLTGQNYNSRDIVQNIFSPLIGVLCSPHADEVCHRNNLSFAELLQPFAKLQNDAHFRDVTGTSVSIRGLRLNFCDVDWRPPQTVLARKMLNESVTNAHNDKTKMVHLSDISLEVPTYEPWFENWRETFLTVQFPADHEFTRHLLSCLIVLSSSEPNIVETAHKLSQRVHQMQSVTPAQKLPKWFQSADVLNSYVVLHEGTQGDLSKAQQGYEMLKSTFGDAKCFLIQLNSLDVHVGGSEVPDYWTAFLKRQPKTGETGQSGGGSLGDPLSGHKTPQDGVSSIAMPAMQMSLLSEAVNSTEASDMGSILHPLSPVQENATEAINSKFSVSSESIASQTINPNVWTGDFDAPHGQCLNAMDVENIKHFVQDYAVRALIPYVEHLVGILTEAVTNKKGVSKSLLSATKRWFVTSKPGASASNQNAVIYTHESAELQTRKLGDLYFMFGHYNMAFQAYHQAKRDFNADSAWQYYAGALEMAALSAFMLGTANRKTYDYMEDAIVCYLNTCKLQQFATRATLLSMECLKTARLYGEAAKQLIRMTSEESDLRSALLLEQAAYCFLNSTPAMYRTYAFQIVLSGNRYSRAGQRKHAYRCYAQAYQVFQQKSWSLAEDHIQYTMAKQAYMLKKLEEASRSFAHLLRPGSLQNGNQQLSFLKEFIQTQNEFVKRHPEMGLIPHALPHVVQDSIKVLTLSPPPVVTPHHLPATNIDINTDLSDESVWHKLEEMIVTTASANKPLVFKPSRSLFTKENPTLESPLAVQGEPIELSVTITNTIGCGIIFSNAELLWRLKLDNDEELNNMCLFESAGMENPNTTAVRAAIKSGPPQSVQLDEKASQTLYFKLTPKLTGRLTIVGIVGQVASAAEPNASLLGSLQFETQILKAPGNKAPAFDQKLNIRIIPTLPSLSVSFSAIPNDLLAGEIIPLTISFRNENIKPIEEIYLGCDNPRWLTLQDKDDKIPLSLMSSIKDLSNEKLVKDKEIRQQHVFRLFRNKSTSALKAQDTTTLTLWLQAPFENGEFTLRLLFYYALPSETTSASGGNLKYRLVRHKWQFNIHECLHAEAACVLSNSSNGELGINLEVRNENKMHHPLMAEIYVNSLALYCEKFQLNKDKLYPINQMEIASGLLGENCIKPSKTASYQCRLMPSHANGAANENKPLPQNLLKARLSHLDMMPSKLQQQHEQNLPKMFELHSFLANHETVYFNASITTEEFNNIVASYEPHTTIAICWTAAIVQNSIQRQAYGQHFIQLKTIYEKRTCPLQTDEIKQFKSNLDRDQLQHLNIQQFCDKHPLEINAILSQMEAADRSTERYLPFGDATAEEGEDDFWEPNEMYVGQRCLLEDESFLLATKA